MDYGFALDASLTAPAGTPDRPPARRRIAADRSTSTAELFLPVSYVKAHHRRIAYLSVTQSGAAPHGTWLPTPVASYRWTDGHLAGQPASKQAGLGLGGRRAKSSVPARAPRRALYISPHAERQTERGLGKNH